MINHVSLALLASTFALAVATEQAGKLAPLAVETVHVDGRARTYRVYAPAGLPPGAPALFVLHGSGGDGERMRGFTALEFERIADDSGMLVVYPEGFEGYWNDCRTATTFSAHKAGVDDLRYLQAVRDELSERYAIDPARAFAVGYSNGGQMVFRAALERPDMFAGYAVFGANLPVKSNNDCKAAKEPVSMLVLNGTKDPINPYGGGEVRTPDQTPRGKVLSTDETVRYWRKLSRAAEGSETTMRYPNAVITDRSTVEQTCATGETGREVCLMKVIGGGHAMPHPAVRYPDLVGEVNRDINGPREIWGFFERASLN